MKTQKQKINVFLTSLVIFIVVVAVGIVYIPSIMGMEAYTIETGSMAPKIPEGSMVYVRKYFNFDDYKVNDIVTFTDNTTGKSFTHRIISINPVAETFKTKGDANTEPDLSPTEYIYAVGKVEFSIPYLGYVAAFLKNTVVKIALGVIYVAWAAIEIELYLTERKKKYD